MDNARLRATMARRPAWVRGAFRALPIVMGYIPIGFAYGVLAQQAGLSQLNSVLMSVLVYAGSAQLIAVGLFAAAAPALSIVVTTLIVNLRHLLFSAALSPYLKGWRKLELAAFAYELTDEAFALHSARFPEEVPPKAEIFALNMTAQLSWVLGSYMGVATGRLITDVKPLALDYTLPALFIALLVLQLKGRRDIVIAVFTGVLSVALTLMGGGRWSVIFATVIGATLGLALEHHRISAEGSVSTESGGPAV